MFIVKWTSLTLSFGPKWSPKEQKCHVIFFTIASSNHEKKPGFFLFTLNDHHRNVGPIGLKFLLSKYSLKL